MDPRGVQQLVEEGRITRRSALCKKDLTLCCMLPSYSLSGTSGPNK